MDYKPGDAVIVDAKPAVVVAAMGANAICKMPDGTQRLVPFTDLQAAKE